MTSDTSGMRRTRPLTVRPDQRPGTPVFTCVSNDDVAPHIGRAVTVGSVAGLRTLRRSLASWLHEVGLGVSSFVADVQLAVIEVVTNSFVHGDAESVDVRLTVEQREVVIVTQHDSSHAEAVLPALRPQTESISGRGLYIVDQIARERSVSHAGGTSTTTLYVPVPPETVPAVRLVATGTDA